MSYGMPAESHTQNQISQSSFIGGPIIGRVFTVENLDFDDAAAFAALKIGLSFFSLGRGRRPAENFTSNKEFLDALKEAIMRRHKGGFAPSKIFQIDVAEDLFPESKHRARELRRWLQKSWRKWRWPAVVKATIEDEARDRQEVKAVLTVERW